MTKDNWIKAFDEQFSFIGGCIDRDALANYLTIKKYGTEHLQDIKAFISQVEHDAIEKTNKRWRERIGSMPTVSEYYTQEMVGHPYNAQVVVTHEAISRENLLSTLLEDK